MDTNVPQTPLNSNGVAGKPREPTITGEEHVYKSFEAATADFTPPAPTTKEDIYKLHNNPLIPPLRTYESDVAEALKKKDASVVKIAVAEKKKEEIKIKKKEEVKKVEPPQQEPPLKPQPQAIPQKIQKEPEKVLPIKTKPSFHLPHIAVNKDILVAIISIILIATGGGALGYLIYMRITTTKPVVTVVQKPSIITTDSTQKMLLPPNETIGHALATQAPLFSGSPQSLINVVFVAGTSTLTGNTLDTETFIERWPSTMPSWLSRSFNQNFIFGYQLLNTPQPFIVFKTTSYDDGFAGMLKWEDTLKSDMAALTITSGTSTASHASTTQAILGSVFEDTVVDNKDVRVLRDSVGNPIVMYSLPDKQTIVITTNETTLKEIFARLSTSQFTQ